MSRQNDALSWFFRLLLSTLFLAACAGPAPRHQQTTTIDQQWTSTMQAGLSAFTQDRYELAAKRFQRALKRGRLMDDAQAIRDAAFNQAVCQIRLGDYKAATDLLLEAENETRRSDTDLTEIRLAQVKLLKLQNDPTRALALSKPLLNSVTTTNRDDLLYQTYLLHGLLACDAGDLFLAKGKKATARQTFANTLPPGVAANYAELLGCIAKLENKPLIAARHYDHEADYLQKSHQYYKMIAALSRAGKAYADAGQNHEAAERLFRAARSALNQKRLATAVELGQLAKKTAAAGDYPDLSRQIKNLNDEILAKTNEP